MIRRVIQLICVVGFALTFAFMAKAHAEPEADATASPQPEGIAPLDAKGNIVTPTPVATTPGPSTPISTPWIAPPPHSRNPMPFTPAMVGGFALILLGISFFWAEAQASTHGAFAAAGVLCVIAGLAFIFGYTLLAITISWSAVGPLVIAVIGVMAWTVYKGFKQMNDAAIGDLSEHVGKIVQAAGALKPEGKVILEGNFWNAISTKPVADGAKVRIVSADGLTLRVEPVGDA